MNRITKILALTLCLITTADVSADGRGRRNRRWQPAYEPAQTWQSGYQEAPAQYYAPTAPVVASSTPTTASTGDDALAEVNAARAQRGLPPYLNDPLLNQAARACAYQRAARGIEGHLPESDFTYVRQVGANATTCGCAAWTPDWGWGACETYGNYTYAGAAWAWGPGGKRFMHLVLR